MLTSDQSEPTGGKLLPGEPWVPPYGLHYFHGEKVSVSFGWLESGIWGEQWCRRVRLVFTFDHALGLLESSWASPFDSPSLHLGPHQLCIIAANRSVTLHWVHKAPVVVLYVEPNAIDDVEFLVWDFMGEDFRMLARRNPALAHLAQMFLTLCHQSDRPEPEFVEGIGMALAFQTIAQFRSRGGSTPPVRSGLPLDMVDRITSYIDAHLSETITAGDLARVAGLSPDHFARRFKISTKMSPKQYMLWRRMDKVRELLRTRNLNVTEAGREVGFHDPSHLSRRFRGVFGFPPKTVMKAAPTGSADN